MFQNRKTIIMYGVLLAITLLAGCGGGGGVGTGEAGKGDVTSPVIFNTSATSPTSSAGGTSTIKADVTDDGSVKSVTAVVTDPDGDNSPVLSMSLGTGNTYSCSYNAAENDNSYAVTYSVVVTARDMTGNTSTSGSFTFTVPGNTPPAPPDF